MDLLQKYKKTPEWTAFVSALVVGGITHFFALATVLHNFDDIANLPAGFGGAATLGRWLLEIVGGFFEKCGLTYNLPVFNGLMFILLLAVTAGFLVSTLQIKNKMSAALAGGLFIVFPTVSATLFYRYTVPYYGLGVLLSVLAVWVLRKGKYGLVLSALCLGCSMGLYQAYAPLTIGLFVLLLIQQVLQGETDIRKIVCTGLYDCLALILGVAIYFIGTKLSQAMTHVELGAYQGVDTMGQLALADIPRLVWQSIDQFCDIASQDYCGVSGRKAIQLTYRALGAVSAVMIVYILTVKVRKSIAFLMTAVLCLLFPIAVNFIVVMVPDGWIYTLMVYSFVLVACLPLVLLECLPEGEGKHGRAVRAMTGVTSLLVALLVFCYGYYDNVNYSALYFANRQVENYVSSIVVQTRMTEGFTPDKEWALIGQINDPLLGSDWDEEAYYGGNSYAQHLLINYSRNKWFENYVGYDLPLVSDETLEELIETDEVKAMPCWPSQGSIKMVGDTMVLKFQELSK